MDHRERQLEDDPEEVFRDVTYIVGPGLESDNRQFGELLERLRWKAGLSRADAAAKLGFSAEYLRLIEGGKRTPALGQMQHFLSVYAADGAVERLMSNGERPDLLVIDPLDGDPVFVQFKSRIREARRRALGGLPDEGGEQDDLHQAKWVRARRPSARRAAQLGVVVSLLTRADDSTISKIREMLEDEVGSRGSDAGD